MIKSFTIALVLATAALMTTGSLVAAKGTVTGTWNVSMVMSSHGTMTGTMVLQQSGMKITGTMTMHGQTMDIQGMLKGQNITLGMDGMMMMGLKGVVSTDYTSMKGKMDMMGHDHGSWSATKQ